MRKRKIVSALLLASMAISLAGCSSTASSSGASGTTASGDKTVIEVWTNDRHDLDYVTGKIDEYNSTNTDNIEIKQTVITDDLSNMLSMATSSGTAPDIAVTSGSSGIDMKVFADAGMVIPINDYVEASGEEFETVTENSKHQFEGMNVIEGQLYWVPTVVRSGSRMIYNDTLATEAGMTEFPSKLEDMVTLSQEITTNGDGKYYGMAATSSSPFVRSLEGIAEMSGQNRYGYDYVNGKFDFSGFKEVLEVYQGLLASDSLLPGSATQGVDAMRAQFADGTVGLWANASQEAGVFTTQFPVENFEWKVAELPTVNDEVVGALSSMPQKGYMIMSSSKNPDAAWKVIEFFSSEDFLKGYLEEGFALPFSDKMSSVIDAEKAGRISDFALKDYESVYPVAPSVSLEGDNLQVVLWSAAMGERSIDDAIEDLNTRYNAALEKDISMGKVKRLIIKDYDPLNPNAGTATYTES